MCFQVTVAAEGDARNRVGDVLDLSVRNSSGEMVPFSAFASIEPSFGASTVSRYNMYNTASVTATPAKGVSSASGIKAMEGIVEGCGRKIMAMPGPGEGLSETQSGTTITFRAHSRP